MIMVQQHTRTGANYAAVPSVIFILRILPVKPAVLERAAATES